MYTYIPGLIDSDPSSARRYIKPEILRHFQIRAYMFQIGKHETGNPMLTVGCG